MHILVIIGIIVTIFLLSLAIACQVLLLTSTETEKLKNSLHVWFGSAGIGGVWVLCIMVLVLIFYLPGIFVYMSTLSQQGSRALTKVELAADSLQDLAKDFKKSTKISELLQTGVKIATEAAQSLKKMS